MSRRSPGRLERLDRASAHGPWTSDVLACIAAEPGRRAPDFAARFGREVQPFKRDVRKLKEIGLTISLLVGYELSPRGEAYLAALDSAGSREAGGLLDRASSAQHGVAVTASRVARRPLDRTRHADGCDDGATPVANRRADRRHTGLALLDALDPTAPRDARFARGAPARRAARERQAAPTATIVRSPCGDSSDSSTPR